MIIKTYTDYINSINEGLIKTYDGNISINELVRSLKLLKFNVSGQFDKDEINLTIFDFNQIPKNKIDDLFDHISSILTNRFGWFPSSMNIHNIYGQIKVKRYDESELKLKQEILKEIIISFNCKFDDIINEKIDKLYHLSIQEYEAKILKYGLFPKSKSKLSSHIDRIYLCKFIEDCENLIPEMKLHYSDEQDINLYTLGNKKWRKNTKWIIFEIDNSLNDMKLYKDPHYFNGYYTLNNISPDIIKVLKKEA